jgi:hypothetical protein
MSNEPKKTPYIYQPFGIQNKAHWDAKRIYAVATDSMLTTISGLTKDEAERVLSVVAPVEERKRPTIEELEKILNSEEDTPITIHADGSISA